MGGFFSVTVGPEMYKISQARIIYFLSACRGDPEPKIEVSFRRRLEDEAHEKKERTS